MDILKTNKVLIQDNEFKIGTFFNDNALNSINLIVKALQENNLALAQNASALNKAIDIFRSVKINVNSALEIHNSQDVKIAGCTIENIDGTAINFK